LLTGHRHIFRQGMPNKDFQKMGEKPQERG